MWWWGYFHIRVAIFGAVLSFLVILCSAKSAIIGYTAAAFGETSIEEEKTVCFRCVFCGAKILRLKQHHSSSRPNRSANNVRQHRSKKTSSLSSSSDGTNSSIRSNSSTASTASNSCSSSDAATAVSGGQQLLPWRHLDNTVTQVCVSQETGTI